jgi:tryptophan-associated transmembrane protein
MADPATGRRTGFGAVVLAGLATAGLTSVAAGKPWFRADVDKTLAPVVSDADRVVDMPLALALSLVVLAGWGALLVTRGRVRRGVAGLALLAGLGVVACVAVAPFTLPDQARENLPEGSTDVSVSPTGWYLTAAVTAVLAVAVLVVAWLRAPGWPTMSSRYDAPTARAGKAADADLWKALDEGHDPTDSAGPSAP